MKQVDAKRYYYRGRHLTARKALPLQTAREDGSVEGLVGDSPALEPLEMSPLAARSNHTERDGPEQPVQTNDNNVQNAEDGPLYLLV